MSLQSILNTRDHIPEEKYVESHQTRNKKDGAKYPELLFPVVFQNDKAFVGVVGSGIGFWDFDEAASNEGRDQLAADDANDAVSCVGAVDRNGKDDYLIPYN